MRENLASRSRKLFQVSAAKEIAVVMAFTIALELLVFQTYFAGLHSPPWDFFGQYNAEAYYWWTFGGFFNPVDWVPTNWAGYPAASMLQNSAWYLPVGIMAAYGDFTLHSSAVLAALHVGFGAIGTYVLAKKLGSPILVALFALVGGFFAAGYFSNAQHVDITRAYSWIPWVLALATPFWKWKSPAGFFGGTLILWQFVSGAYPGVLVASAYVLVFWVVLMQVLNRSKVRNFLLPLLISSFIAILLSAPRIVPYLLLNPRPVSRPQDNSVFDHTNLTTLLFDYSSDLIPGDISMRSIFVPATVFVLLFFGSRHDVLFKGGLQFVLLASLWAYPQRLGSSLQKCYQE